MRWFSFLAVLISLSACAAQDYHIARPTKFSGMSDASGAVALSTNLFAAASDEDNTLRVYDANHPGPPVSQLDCNAFLELTGRSPEADLEAAARIGKRIFWMGSHGRNKNGKLRPNRCRLFATDFQIENGRATLAPIGKPCKILLDALCQDPRFARFDLTHAASLSPKEPGALNIEGLSATPDGHLLIGFRNPIPKEKALLIPLLNPNEVIEGQAPRFGAAIELDLGGLGVRDIEWTGKDYLIIAGSFAGGHKSRLYRWTGDAGAQPEWLKIKHFEDYNPEGLIFYPETAAIQIISDDGTMDVGGVPQKEVPDPTKRTFRSFWLESR